MVNMKKLTTNNLQSTAKRKSERKMDTIRKGVA